MTQPYWFSVSIRIWHPSINPELISSGLGIEPDHCHEAGARRRTPRGDLLGGTYPESYWCANPFGIRDYSSLDNIAEEVLQDSIVLLKPKREFLQSLVKGGGRVSVDVGSHGDRNYALELSPLLLSDFASLGVAIVHDVYPVAQRRS